MKSITHPILLIILVFFSGNIISQDAMEIWDRVYGLDQQLYNGKKYTYFLPAGTNGDQFLISPDYITGQATIQGFTYQNIYLNYDIFNQQLLLRYEDETGAINIIEVSKAWLSGFKLADKTFKYLDFDDGPRFYQVLGDGPLQILYYWRKELKLDNDHAARNYTFSTPIRYRYVLLDGKLRTYRSNKGLISLFDPSLRPSIKDYIRNNRIKIKKAPDQAVSELINYIGNL